MEHEVKQYKRGQDIIRQKQHGEYPIGGDGEELRVSSWGEKGSVRKTKNVQGGGKKKSSRTCE